MNKTLTAIAFLPVIFISAQVKTDSTKTENIAEVTVIAKKPSIENKADRTVFNVANSSILAGNTTWDILRMTPQVSMDSNDNLLAEGESVTVYINDRKTVFRGKELKDYLKTIAADNLMKIEVITTPSARYEASGPVINIVLKKLENEGVKGSVSLTNTQNTKNSQSANFNINYHKKNFTETLTGGYSDNTSVMKNDNENFIYQNSELTKIHTESTEMGKSPSFSTTSELELNDKNSIGFIFEYSQTKRNSFSDANGETFNDNVLQNYYLKNQNLTGLNRNLGSNLFYKYYDKEKNRILDLNIGINYSSVTDTNSHIITSSTTIVPTGIRILADNQNRDYYFKADYSQPLGKSGSTIEFGGKTNFKNYVIPYDSYKLEGSNWIEDLSRSNDFQYLENLNSVYANFSKTFFNKLETRIGIRYEYIWFKVRQDVGNIAKTTSYGTLLPDLLLKYPFSDNYVLTATYKHNIWRPWYSEMNPFELPLDNGNYVRGNMDLKPNPNDRYSLKLGLYKKYFVTASYWYSNQDYWTTYFKDGEKTIQIEENFPGNVMKYGLNFNTNQVFLKNKLNVNLSVNVNYTDNSDFNAKNNLKDAKDYFANFGGSSNISYNNLLNKNININGWFGLFSQNYGNSYGNQMNFFHNISVTKIFPKTQMEASLQMYNIFKSPVFDVTTYAPIGTFRNSMQADWYGFSLTFIKRFGNQKVKENTKTNVEKDSGGSKN